MITVTSPPQYVHVGNPVFVTINTDNTGTTILLDVIHQGIIQYTAAVSSNATSQRINIAEVLVNLVNTPTVWPLPDDIVKSITNWLIQYRFEVREMSGTEVISSYASPYLFACPGNIDPELYRDLASAGSDIFQSRLLNPAANRFLTGYASAIDTHIRLPANQSALLYFIAQPGETIRIITPTQQYAFPLGTPSLYILNLSTFCAAGQSVTAQFSGGMLITINFTPIITSWPVRAWLFLNHFGVFEPFFTTGRAQQTVNRPETTTNRYINSIDSYHAIDLPSTPVNTIKLSSGLNTIAAMEIHRHFTMSDWIYLVSAGILLYHIIKKDEKTFRDDNPEPQSNNLELTQSVREQIQPVYLDNLDVFRPDPAEIMLPHTAGSFDIIITSIVSGQPVGWTFRYIDGIPESSNIIATVTKINATTVRVTYAQNNAYMTKRAAVEFTQTGTGKTTQCAIKQWVTSRQVIAVPDTITADYPAGQQYVEIINTDDGVRQLDWDITLQDDVTWCSAVKASSSQALITRSLNPSNINRGPVVFQVQSKELDNNRHQIEYLQLPNPAAIVTYAFSIDTSGAIHILPDGNYEGSIPATGNGTISLPVISTTDSIPSDWEVYLSGTANASRAGNNLNLTPPDNTSPNPVTHFSIIRQLVSLTELRLTLKQAGTTTPDYTFLIEGSNLIFPKSPTSQQTRHVSSYSSGLYIGWSQPTIQYIDGGTGWLSAEQSGEDIIVNTLTINTSGAMRSALIKITQNGSGLTQSRSVTQDPL